MNPVEELPEPETVRQFSLNHGMNLGQGMNFFSFVNQSPITNHQ
ncbi:MAG: hypothetical protein ACOC1Z_00340 [Cyanobacteriota bacterium]